MVEESTSHFPSYEIYPNIHGEESRRRWYVRRRRGRRRKKRRGKKYATTYNSNLSRFWSHWELSFLPLNCCKLGQCQVQCRWAIYSCSTNPNWQSDKIITDVNLVLASFSFLCGFYREKKKHKGYIFLRSSEVKITLKYFLFFLPWYIFK